MDGIFDFQHTKAPDSVLSSVSVLSDPKNTGIAFGISLLLCIQAEIYVIYYLLSVNGGHLWNSRRWTVSPLVSHLVNITTVRAVAQRLLQLQTVLVCQIAIVWCETVQTFPCCLCYSKSTDHEIPIPSTFTHDSFTIGALDMQVLFHEIIFPVYVQSLLNRKWSCPKVKCVFQKKSDVKRYLII